MSKLQFRNVAGRNPELLVYGDIDEWWGEVQSKAFAENLQAITADVIDVRINSNGGDVFAAQAIYSSLKRHAAEIHVYIDGMAASAATIIAMAGDKVFMPENAMFMIHNPLTGVWGNANELREVADILDKVRETLLAVYRDKSGLADDKLIELMDDDTYMTAAEAHELGFVDEIIAPLKIAAKRLDSGDVELNGLTIRADRYKRLPEQLRNDVECQRESGTSGETEEKEVIPMTLDELKAQHPELYQAAVGAGQEQERARIQAIDEMVLPGQEALAAKAKFETGITAEAFAMELIKAEKAVKEKFLADRKSDADPVNKVVPAVDPAEGDEDIEREAVTNTMAAAFSARNRRK